jgi:hypothetical protein
VPTLYLAPVGDTFVSQRRAQRNYVRRTFIAAGRDEDGYRAASLIVFRVRGALPAGATITEGKLLLTVIDAFAHTPQPTYGVYRVLSRWRATAVTWSSRPAFAAVPVSTFPHPPLGVLSIDVTRLAGDWFAGRSAEFGVTIRARSVFAVNTYFCAASVNAADSDTWPRLKLNYTLPAISVAPRFVDEHYTLAVAGLSTAFHDIDVSLFNPVSVWATNNGPGDALTQLLISPDGVNFVPDSPSYALAANQTVSMVASVFSQYLRVMVTTTGINEARIALRCQGHA